MKPHPRLRKTIKWGGAALTVLLVVVWIGSGWWGHRWTSVRGAWIGVYAGQVDIGYVSPSVTNVPQFYGIHPLNDYRGGFAFETGFYYKPLDPRRPFWQLAIPVWFPAVLVFIPTALAFRLDTLARRRARMNLCAKCHYDRTGLAANANCPECGQPPRQQ